MKQRTSWWNDALSVAAWIVSRSLAVTVYAVIAGTLMSVGAALWGLAYTPPETVFTVSASASLHAALKLLAVCVAFAAACFGAIGAVTGWLPSIPLGRVWQQRFEAALPHPKEAQKDNIR